MKPLRERLTPDFDHVTLGDDPRVFEKLADPAYNLAVWENAASENITTFFSHLTPKEFEEIDYASREFYRRNVVTNPIDFKDVFEGCFPDKQGKKEAIDFLLYLNSIYCQFMKTDHFEAGIRLDNTTDRQGMHADTVDFRLFVSLGRLDDQHGGDGSTRIISNSFAQSVMNDYQQGRRKGPLIRQKHPGYFQDDDVYEKSIPAGAGNVMMFSGVVQKDRFPLYHGRSQFKPRHFEAFKGHPPKKFRMAYVLTSPKVISLN